MLLNKAFECCRGYRHEFIMPEHLLLAMLDDTHFWKTLNIFYGPDHLRKRIEQFLGEVETIDADVDYEIELSEQMSKVIEVAVQQVMSSSAQALDVPHLVKAILMLDDSWAAFLLKESLNGKESTFMAQLISAYETADRLSEGRTSVSTSHQSSSAQNSSSSADSTSSSSDTADSPSFLDDYDLDYEDDADEHFGEDRREDSSSWRRLVTCMNDHYAGRNPLIGREQELNRTIQVLCRYEKNNPLHVGEPGVGKTALVWGLVKMIAEGRVPERLIGAKVYQLDLGTLIAGTQYRGDFENRIKQIMDGVAADQDNPAEPVANIIYIDEIHTLVGAGAVGDSAMDASNMLKPYLEAGTIRFIGSTTYDEYNRHFARSKGLMRRFQQIDIAEPTVDEAKHILRQLQPLYEQFHQVTYEADAVDFAVDASNRHVTDRFLPDKAIDLIDEAGAAKEIGRPSSSDGTEKPTVTKADIADVLAKTCKVDALAEAADDDYARLESLATRMLSQIYGQDEAIRQVVEAVQMSQAGLLDDNKPLASLLFVGPTGVGKTEVARVLARELGIELVRFDMSEYTEKHTVAKLIGSPAGYVGYEDGGLLTDAIRKSPNCVLLLDEIEKAHQDIYNILLQVMDYARLTDNKGRKADFRHVIVIMTSNAGAQYASQSSVGFSSRVTRGDAMMHQVKKTFKPEFLNRLSGAVVFHDMDRQMATLILQKKLRELDAKLAARQVKLTLTDKAFDHLLNEGFTTEYGAREMDRVIAQQLKPLLMREILFGSLKHGGEVTVAVLDSQLVIAHS